MIPLHKFFTWQLAVTMLLITLVFLAFGHSLQQGFAPVDDSFLLVENPAIRGITAENLKTVFTTYDPELYIPMVFVSYQLDYLIGGLDPFFFHLTNILLHILSALLVVRILRQLTGTTWLAWFSGFVFALHPLNTEAVVWLAGRKDLLSGVFFLGAMTLYLDAVKGKRKALLASILLFLLALLSKVIAVTFLGFIVLHMVLIERPRWNRKIAMRITPYAVLSVIFMIIAMGGKSRVLASTSLWDKVLVAAKSTVFYLQKFLWPTDLVMIYPLQGDLHLLQARILPYAIITAILLVIALRSWRSRPWITFAIGWYIAILAPTYLNIGKAGLLFFAVDRYMYLPMVAVLFAMIYLLRGTQERIKLPAQAIIILGSIVIVICCIGSFRQTKVWDTPDGLFEHNLAVYPESVGVRVGLGNIYRKQGRLEEAFTVLKDGLAYTDHMLLHLYVGFVYSKAGHIADAEEQFTIATTMDPLNPEPIFSLGSLYEQTGREERALPLYEQAVALDSSYVIARVKLGTLYQKAGRISEARQQFEEALQWNVNSVEAKEALRKLEEDVPSS